MKKKILFAVMAAVMAVSCTESNKYVINGTISDKDGQTVYLQYQIGDSTVKDSTVIADGKFMFKGQLDRPYREGTLAMGDLNANYGQDADYLRIALEPGTITVNTEGMLKDATVTGGKTQTEMNALMAELKPCTDKMEEMNKAYYGAETDALRDSLRAAMEPIQKQYGEITSNFYKTHGDSYLAPGYLRFDTGNMTYEEIKAVYDNFTDEVKQYGDGIEDIKSELDALEKIQPGKEAPDFTAEDINGKQFTLSSLKGKVVILDFWASWCKPCRASNPHMLQLYKKYYDKGLELVYVSDDDSEPEKWRKAVEEDKLVGDGIHHVLRGLKWDRSKGLAGMDHTNDISDRYAIHFLPTKYLIDREGKIIGKVNDEELDAKLKEIFGF